ncbi:MAG: uroporphyrinogen-III synthase [Nitrospiraceae bacterium]
MPEPTGFAGLCVAAFESRLAAEMERLIVRYGGRPLVAPSMRELPLQDDTEALEFGEQLLAGRFNLLILLTGVGTRALIEVLQARYSLDRIKAALAHVTLVARGPKPVAALKELGLKADLTVPEPNTWHDIVQVLDAAKPVTGLRVAVQEYGVSNVELLQALRDRGAEVVPVPVYRWALPEDTEPLRHAIDAIFAGEVDVILITNAVQVDHLLQLIEQDIRPDHRIEHFRDIVRRMVVASIGPMASERLRSRNLPVDLEPSHPKMGVLVKEASERALSLLEWKRVHSPK